MHRISLKFPRRGPASLKRTLGIEGTWLMTMLTTALLAPICGGYLDMAYSVMSKSKPPQTTQFLPERIAILESDHTDTGPGVVIQRKPGGLEGTRRATRSGAGGRVMCPRNVWI